MATPEETRTRTPPRPARTPVLTAVTPSPIPRPEHPPPSDHAVQGIKVLPLSISL